LRRCPPRRGLTIQSSRRAPRPCASHLSARSRIISGSAGAGGRAHSHAELADDARSRRQGRAGAGRGARRELWNGQGLDEVGIDAKSGEILVKIDPRYFALRKWMLCLATRARQTSGLAGGRLLDSTN